MSVIDNGGEHGEERQTGDIYLQAGRHSIRVRYFDTGYGALLRLLWCPPGLPEMAVPPEVLLPDEGALSSPIPGGGPNEARPRPGT